MKLSSAQFYAKSALTNTWTTALNMASDGRSLNSLVKMGLAEKKTDYFMGSKTPHHYYRLPS